MKIVFTFNTTHTVSLIPENGKDRGLLQLCFGGSGGLRLAPSPANNPESVVVEVVPGTEKGPTMEDWPNA